jgi:hypothetical protein
MKAERIMLTVVAIALALFFMTIVVGHIPFVAGGD